MFKSREGMGTSVLHVLCTKHWKSLTHSIPLTKPHLSEQFTLTSTAALLITCVRLGKTDAHNWMPAWKTDANWFDILLPALVALCCVAHTASNVIAVSAFTFKFAHTNLFSLNSI